MEVRGIDKPFEWSREVVSKLQKDGTGLYYSPSREPSQLHLKELKYHLLKLIQCII